MIFFFRWTCVAGLLLLTACAGANWNPSTWFGGGNLQQPEEVSKDIHPGFGSGPLAAPNPAPAIPVQKSTIATAAGSAPEAASSVGGVKVALLVPLSGNNAGFGQALLNAAQMAVFDAAQPSFELMPRDTTRKDGAAGAARDAVASGAQLLIGPLFAVEVAPAHAATAQTGVSLLTFSTDAALEGHGVYVMGFAPEAQVERVVAYATAHGAHRFAALLPANAYGSVVGEAFRASVLHHGGTIIATDQYDPIKHDSGVRVRSIATLRSQIDALFLPEGGSDLGLIAAQLAAAGFDNHSVHLLGTGLWDEPNLARMQNFLVGGWYAAPDPAARANFIASYQKTYNQVPPRLATLAYDATALAAALAKNGAAFNQVALTNPNGFAGLDGIFRLLPSGAVERKLAVIEVSTEGPHVIEPAPTTFAAENN